MPDVDVIVVGAGPAGACAALTLARAGRDVVLLERGPFPGSKNMYGGVVYPRVLDGLIPQWWDEAPIQRWVTRRSTMMMTATQALAVDFRTEAWGQAPYNGATAYRPDFDAWLAGKAEAEGARLLCSTTVTGLLRDGTRVVGVRTDRPEGELSARWSSPATASTASWPRRPGSTTTPIPVTSRWGSRRRWRCRSR